MSGIAAAFGGIETEAGSRMLERMAHRGPDDEGSVTIGGHWLGHRRLAIADPQNGRQPLTNAEESLCLVGNGQVFNDDAVRLSLSGASFTNGSDNEVIIHLYDQRGPEAFAELSGAYAFAMAGEDGRFVAARDPVGVKPLYWARRNGDVRFASEMRAFDASWQSDVQVFPPGHFWCPEMGLVRFADAVPESRAAIDRFDGPSEAGAAIPEAILDLVRQELIEAVERQLVSDVPVGVFLSGGLDSTLVAAIAARWYARRGETLKTFAVGSADSLDLAAARMAAEYLGTEHHERIYTDDDAFRVLPEVVRVIEHYDPSLVRSSVANYLLAEFAADHVKVVLTGEGADEIFAGYEHLCEISDAAELHRELVALIEGMHNLGLQRGDRVTMAHGIEGRLPFLDQGMIGLGLSLSPGWKLAGDGQPEKRLLRMAFEGWLPEELLWRKKAQFGDGSGAADTIQQTVEESITRETFLRERGDVTPMLRTREELAYYRIFREMFPQIEPSKTLGLFATA